MRTLLPTIFEEKFYDGKVINSVGNCFQKYNCEACKKFYQKLNNQEEGYYTCPSGYTVYHQIIGNSHRFICGIFVKGHFNKIKSKKFQNIRILNEQFFEDMMIEQNTYIQMQENTEMKEEVQRNLLHDIKKLDSLIKNKSENILRDYGNAADDYKDILSKVRNIEAMESLISCKYAVYDLAANLGMIDILSSSSSDICVYRKFDKVRYILLEYKNKGIDISFKGETNFTYKANLVHFELLPFLLLENAVKYSIGNHDVVVSFEEYHDSLYVYIKSFGPYCEEREISNIFNKNYRGNNASKYVSDGTGIGLFLVKQICDQYNIDIRISSDYVKNINGIPCGYFKVELIF